MSGAEFERRDRRENRSDGDGSIPRVSHESMWRLLREFSEVQGSVDHLVGTYLGRISTVNPIVVEYILGVAVRMPKGLSAAPVAMAGILVYRVLELEFEQLGKKMPIVQREIADRLKTDPDQKKRYFLESGISLVTENHVLLEYLASFPLTLIGLFKEEVPRNQVASLVLESCLGVYALIKAQAEVDSLSGL